MQADPDRLRAALEGRVRDHHRFLLQLHLDQIAALERGRGTIDARLGELLRPFEAITTRLRTMPGVSHVVAQTLVAEIGVDMHRFPTPGHLRSWVGLCPRLDESAGKRRSTRIRHGAPWLKTVLVQAAWTAVRNRDSYPHAQCQRLKARRGAKKAIVAVAASLLTAAYFILRDDVLDRGWARLGTPRRLRRLSGLSPIRKASQDRRTYLPTYASIGVSTPTVFAPGERRIDEIADRLVVQRQAPRQSTNRLCSVPFVRVEPCDSSKELDRIRLITMTGNKFDDQPSQFPDVAMRKWAGVEADLVG